MQKLRAILLAAVVIPAVLLILGSCSLADFLLGKAEADDYWRG